MTYDSRQVAGQGGSVETIFYAKGAKLTGTQEAADAWLAKVRSASTPAPQATVEAWLAELSVSVARRQEDQFSEALRMAVYAKALAGFPADVVKDALRPARWKFWPALSEVEDLCRALGLTRQVFAAARVVEPPKFQAPPPPNPEAEQAAADARKLEAERLLSRLGFTQARTDFVRSHPMAKDITEAEARKVRTPHWSETAAADDERHEMVRKSRLKSTVIPMEPSE